MVFVFFLIYGESYLHFFRPSEKKNTKITHYVLQADFIHVFWKVPDPIKSGGLSLALQMDKSHILSCPFSKQTTSVHSIVMSEFHCGNLCSHSDTFNQTTFTSLWCCLSQVVCCSSAGLLRRRSGGVSWGKWGGGRCAEGWRWSPTPAADWRDKQGRNIFSSSQPEPLPYTAGPITSQTCVNLQLRFVHSPRTLKFANTLNINHQ